MNSLLLHYFHARYLRIDVDLQDSVQDHILSIVKIYYDSMIEEAVLRNSIAAGMELAAMELRTS